jgi:hypothetical protein
MLCLSHPQGLTSTLMPFGLTFLFCGVDALVEALLEYSYSNANSTATPWSCSFQHLFAIFV